MNSKIVFLIDINKKLSIIDNTNNNISNNINYLNGLIGKSTDSIMDKTLFGRINFAKNHLNNILEKLGNIDLSTSIDDLILDYDNKIKLLEESIHNGKTYSESTSQQDNLFSNDQNIDKYETLYECIMYDSTCYKGTGKMKPVGILWHDTGANNTFIKRYVQPSKSDPNYNKLLNLIGKNQYANDWNTIEHNAGVNAWIGKLADGTVATVQALPWDYRPWGCGSGNYGSLNNGWIQFEICEDAKDNSTYFNSVYKEALKLTAYLCKKFNINPKGTINYNGISVPTIVCHWDSYKLGVGSGHYDIYDWFPKFGKCKNLTMEDVRNDVAAILGSIDSSSSYIYFNNWVNPEGRRSQYLTQIQMENNAKLFWSFASRNNWSIVSVAGILGCLENESNINPSTKNYSEMDRYDNENYGIGLAQWTNVPLATATSGRHKDMVDWVTKNYGSWNSGPGQCEFLKNDLYNRKTTCSINQLTSIIPYDLRHKNGKDFALCKDSRWTVKMAVSWFLGCFEAGTGDKSAQSYYDSHWSSWMSSREKSAEKWYKFLSKL